MQMPADIAEIFRENKVTGYDFPEIVDDGAETLKQDLGITKDIFVRKLTRGIKMRMLGIGRDRSLRFLRYGAHIKQRSVTNAPGSARMCHFFAELDLLLCGFLGDR
jgi:hypothetical protein